MTPGTSFPRVRNARPIAFTPGKWVQVLVRLVPAAAVLMVFAFLARGRFRSIDTLTWADAAACGLLLLGGVLTTVRRVRRSMSGAPLLLRDELEFGGTLLSAAFIGVALGGELLFPVVYLLMAFLVTFLPRQAAATLLGSAVLFDALLTLPERWGVFLGRALFLGLFAALYHLVLSARLAVARRAEQDAVKNKIKDIEERARTFRLSRAAPMTACRA